MGAFFGLILTYWIATIAHSFAFWVAEGRWIDFGTYRWLTLHYVLLDMGVSVMLAVVLLLKLLSL